MTDRTVKVTLSASVDAFDRAMKQAQASATQLKDSLDQTGDGMGKATKGAADLGRELGKASQSQEWATVSTELTKAGTAGLALGGAIAYTGIQYNTLQQTSRAAMTTLLDGAEAANAQMDQLDEFARTSPFSKAVFIEAQQQMIGFGIETEKVLPYLNNIQDATAAMGGNNHTISELTRIFSQISASAKITATDLREFGNRGIDAATLIGSQMGKTGAQIRDEITAGTLDADAALDALAAGMEQRFGGAAENVKNTMAGATDRVKAAWRDMTAEIMSSAVNQDGGGWLVDLTNDLADFMRTIGGLPTELLQATSAIGAVGAASLLAGGLAMKATTSFVAFNTALTTLRTTAPLAAGAIGAVGAAAAGATALFAGFAAAGALIDYNKTAIPQVEAMTAAIERAGIAAQENALDRIWFDDQGEQVIADVDGIASALERLSIAAGDGGRWQTATSNVHEMVADLTGAASDSDRVAEMFANLDQAMAGLANTNAPLVAEEMQRVVAQFDEAGRTADSMAAHMPRMFDNIRAALEAASDETFTYAATNEHIAAILRGELPDGLEWTENGLRRVATAASEAATSTQDAATGTENLRTRFQGLQEEAAAAEAAIRQVTDAMWAAATGIIDVSNAEIRLEEAYDKATEAIKNNGASLDINTEKGRANQTALNNIVTSAAAYAQTAQEQGESLDVVNTKLDRAREEYVKSAQAAGDSRTAAELLTEAYDRIPDAVETQVDALNAVLSAEQVRDLTNALLGVPPDVKSDIMTIAILDGYHAAMNALDEANGRSVNTYINVVRRMVGSAGIDPRLHNLPSATGGRIGDTAAAYGLAMGGRPYFNGRVTGPGTTTSDEALTTDLSRDEFVLRAWAAQKIGYDRLYYANATGRMPEGRADGGRPHTNDYARMAPVYRPQIHVAAPDMPAAAGEARDPRLDAVLDRMDRMADEFTGLREDWRFSRVENHMMGGRT